MQMTAAGKRSGDKKARKKIFRRMKAQVRVVMAHAGRHRDKLARFSHQPFLTSSKSEKAKVWRNCPEFEKRKK
jgi:hypothetical protein